MKKQRKKESKDLPHMNLCICPFLFSSLKLKKFRRPGDGDGYESYLP